MDLSIPYYRRKGAPITLSVETKGASLVLRFPYHPEMVEEVKCMVGARWDKEGKYWKVDHCDRNLLQLMLLSDQVPEWFKRYTAPVDEAVVLSEACRVKPIRTALKAHQRTMLAHALHKRRLELASDMGTGKTLAAIELLEHVARRFPGEPLLYVGRGTPLEATHLEMEKWGCTLRLNPDVLRFVTFASLHRYLETWPAGKKAPRAVVFDEGQNLKTPTTKQSEAAQHLTQSMFKDHGPDDAWVLCMTGTPAPKDYCDWLGQLEVVQPGYIRESSVTHLRRRLANLEKVDGPYGAYPKFLGWKQEEVDRFAERLAGITIRFLRKDVLDLPEPVYEEIGCPPDAAMVRAAQFVTSTANAGLDLLDKLRQLADGIIADSKDCATVPKDAALLKLLERYEDAGRFAVYAAYTASVDKCVALAANAGWDVLRVDGRGMMVVHAKGGKPRFQSSKDALVAMQSPGEPSDRLCFVGQPDAGGVGLNLQGVTGLCYYSNTFSGGARMQSEARPQRPGNRGLTIFDLICLPSDRLVLNNLKAKVDAQAITLDQIKAANKELK